MLMKQQMKQQKILEGGKASPTLSPLADFEAMNIKNWRLLKKNLCIPDNFLFIVGVIKYSKKYRQVNLRVGKERVFVQSFRNNINRARGYGDIYCLYEPETLYDNDIVLEKAALYQSLPDDTVKMILADGEHRQLKYVNQLFDHIREQWKLQDFSAKNVKTGIYEISFKTKSCGYFLKGRTYRVWATPVGIPKQDSGELVKGWLICDINCGLPALLEADQERLQPLPTTEGTKIGQFTYRNDTLVFE